MVTLHLCWTADDRPVWLVAGSYRQGRAVRIDQRAEQESRLQAALEATGKTRAPRVMTADRRVMVLMRIKADDELAAIADAASIIDHAAARSAPSLLGEVTAIRVSGTPGRRVQ